MPEIDTVTEALQTVVTEALGSLRDNPPFWRPLVRTFLPIEWTVSEYELARNESRRLFLNNEFALGGAETRANYIVDQGFSYAVESKNPGVPVEPGILVDLNEYISAVIETNNLSSMERESMMRYDRDGNAIIRIFDTGGIPHFRFVEDERMKTPPAFAADKAHRHGVVTEPEDSQRIRGYWIEPQPDVAAEFVDEDEIVHIKANVDSSARRGIPIYYPVFKNLRRCEDLLTSMTTMAKARAKVALLMQIKGYTKAKEGETLAKLTQSRQTATDGTIRQVTVEELPYGSVLRTDADTAVTFPQNSVGASDFVAVLQADLRAVGTRLSMPEWMFTGLADQKYSNAFVVEAPTLKAFRRLQQMLASKFGDGRYGQQASLLWRALRLAVRNGLFSRSVLNLVKIVTKPPTLEVRDKQAEAQMNTQYIQDEVYSRKHVQQSLGVDPEQMKKEITEEKPAPMPQLPPHADPGGGAAFFESLVKLLADDGFRRWVTESKKDSLAEGMDELRAAMLQLAIDGDWEAVHRLAELANDPDMFADFLSGHERVTESWTFEAGKSGVFTDSVGRRYRLQDGKRVPLGDTHRPENVAVRKGMQDAASGREFDADAFEAHLKNLSKEELQSHLGELNQSKAGLKKALVDRLVTWAKGRTPPKPAALFDYKQRNPGDPLAKAIVADAENAAVMKSFLDGVAENKDLVARHDAIVEEHEKAKAKANRAKAKAVAAYNAGKTNAAELKQKADELEAEATELAKVRDRADLAAQDWNEACRRELVKAMGVETPTVVVHRPSPSDLLDAHSNVIGTSHYKMTAAQQAVIDTADAFVSSITNSGLDRGKRALLDKEIADHVAAAVLNGEDKKKMERSFRDLTGVATYTKQKARDELDRVIGQPARLKVEQMHADSIKQTKIDYTLVVAASDRAFSHGDFIATDHELKNTYSHPKATATQVHELGHQIEHKKPGASDKVLEFLRYRTKGQTPRPLDTVGIGYSDKEHSCLDDFDRAFGTAHGWYAGKSYSLSYAQHGSTEVLSMGIEKMYTDPHGFATVDPEYFQFLASVLRSK